MTKKSYRVRNWPDYNKSMVQRGSITLWFNEEILKKPSNNKHGNTKYSDMLILSCLTLRQLYRLPLRSTQGLAKSLIKMMGLDVSIPDYTTLCRRADKLSVDFCIPQKKKACH